MLPTPLPAGIPTLLLRGAFFPLLLQSQLGPGALRKASLGGVPLAVYRDPVTRDVMVHSDVCPHQGASLATGRLTSDGTLVCPYHGFGFRQGTFCGVEAGSCKVRANAVSLPLLETHEDADIVYAALPTLFPGAQGLNEPYQPPEATDPAFTKIVGSRLIERPQEMVTENVLDMLHISYVHSFGNLGSPLPKAVRYEPLGLTGGRASFVYKPQRGSLATWLAMGPGLADDAVRVENEFHLPTTTVTRVFVGSSVKTVMTRAQPIDAHSCRLFWTIYRNFYTAPVFDGVMRALMERTLDEDVAQLKNVYPHVGSQLSVGYDVTILKYREALRLALEEQQL